MYLNFNIRLEKIIFSGLQELNKIFLRSSGFGNIRGHMIEDFLADTFPGITSHMLSKCTTADASPITNDFPLDEMFSLIDEARELNFQHCLALIDLSIEVKRQAAERKQLSESFTDPHPELIFGRRKDSWFSQLCIERIGVDHYQHTYVSSARFIEVDYHCISFIEYFLIILWSPGRLR